MLINVKMTQFISNFWW